VEYQNFKTFSHFPIFCRTASSSATVCDCSFLTPQVTMLTRLTRLPCSVTRLGGARGGARVLRASVDTHRRCVGTLPSFAAQGEGQKTPQTMHLTVDDIMAQAADTQRSMRESQAALQAAAAKANKQSAQAGSQVSESACKHVLRVAAGVCSCSRDWHRHEPVWYHVTSHS